MREIKFAKREIKFRAFDKESKKFILNFDLSQNPIYWANKLKDDYIITQFTGLLDKENKEIFEGDVLKDERGILLEVKWGEGEWMAGELALNANNFFNNKSEYLEIIGNVFENSNLLNK